MNVGELLDKIDELLNNGELTRDSNLTLHVFTADGECVEWKNDDISVECHCDSDGLEFNVDASGTDLFETERMNMVEKSVGIIWLKSQQV